jgi:hypothetical protein
MIFDALTIGGILSVLTLAIGWLCLKSCRSRRDEN